MKLNILFSKLSLTVISVFILCSASAQDRVYTADGRMLVGKVTEVGPKEVHIAVPHDEGDVDYAVLQSQIDSIVWQGGKKDVFKQNIMRKRNPKENIPQLNSWSFDVFGFAYLSFSQSYERRLKNGNIGFRIPLYIGFEGGGIAGIGTFNTSQGVYYPQGQLAGNVYNGYYPQSGKGFSIATGINPKFYLIRRRVIRPYIGPEMTVGYSNLHVNEYSYGYGTSYYNTYRYGTFTAVGKFGLTFNPTDKFYLSLDGGCGIGDLFGGAYAIGWTGVWHIGFAMGVNF
jgi:hypothetical protein